MTLEEQYTVGKGGGGDLWGGFVGHILPLPPLNALYFASLSLLFVLYFSAFSDTA